MRAEAEAAEDVAALPQQNWRLEQRVAQTALENFVQLARARRSGDARPCGARDGLAHYPGLLQKDGGKSGPQTTRGGDDGGNTPGVLDWGGSETGSTPVGRR